MNPALLKLALQLLPELWKLVRLIHQRMKNGQTLSEIKQDLKLVNESFAQKDRELGAKMLNDTWSNRPR